MYMYVSAESGFEKILGNGAAESIGRRHLQGIQELAVESQEKIVKPDANARCKIDRWSGVLVGPIDDTGAIDPKRPEQLNVWTGRRPGTGDAVGERRLRTCD